VKRLKIKDLFLFGMLAPLLVLPVAAVRADDAPAVPEKEASAAPQSELDKLKGEWEAVREQQIQMIREKEDQLENLKEEIFAKMKPQDAPVEPKAVVPPAENSAAAANNGAVISSVSGEIEAQKAALQAERQKFFKEMNRQKESLRQLQSSLDEKAKQLQAERERFELEKKSVAP